MLKRRRVLAAKIETTVGTAETLANADGAFNVYDAVIQPNIDMDDRPSQGSMSHHASTPGVYEGTATFKTELVGDGAGGIPSWASTFLPACGFVASGQVYSPTSEAPGTNVKTLTIGSYIDGRLKMLRGAAGTFKIVGESGKKIIFEWTFKGVWVAVTDAAMLAPTYPTDLPIRLGNAALTLGSWTPKIQKVEIDAGGDVVVREDATASDNSGLCNGIVTDRKVVGNWNPESVLVATANPYGDWLAQTERAFQLEVENATDKFTIDAPKTQIIDNQEQDRNNILVDQIDFQCNKNSAAGDDELTLTFAAP